MRRRSLTSAITSIAALAVLCGLAVPPSQAAEQRVTGAGDSYDGFDSKAAEQVRADQCVAVDALRKGGANLFALAQGALALPDDQLHQKLDRDLFDTSTPLHQAYDADAASSSQWGKKAQDQELAWNGAVSSLSFYSQRDGAWGIFERTGLVPWLWQSYSKSIDLFSPFYEPSPTADRATKTAALAVGDPQYTSAGTPAEREAWKLWQKNSGEIKPNVLFVPRVFADDARIFLSAGGFPRTGTTPDTPEFRIAVEDLKSRFASCSWHAPIDPNRVLGKEVAQASAEWQREIAAQAAPRQQILAASASATKALQEGTYTLGQLVGQSWLADYATRWQDYWSAGGVGWIGDSAVTVEVPGAKGNCLDVAGSGKTDGTPVQIYTCNGSAAQQWTLEGGGGDLHLRSVVSQRCLDIGTNGTKIQITECYKTNGQSWQGNPRAAAPLKSATTGKCLDLANFTKGTDARLADCKTPVPAAQNFLIKPSGHQGSGSPLYPKKAEFDKAKKVVADAQATAKKQLPLLKAQLDGARKAATASDTALQTAYGIADAAGAPRGRGLLVGMQKAQVTKGAVAALTALVKAGETAEAATRAAAADSETVAQRALAQAAQSKAEFRREAARTAELQAKAASDAALMHRDNAKKDKETAEAKLAVALKAEGDAKAAAADARAKRLGAEAEEKTALAEQKNAAAKQAEASRLKETAQGEAAAAQSSRERASAAEATASARRDDAVRARDKARDARDDAWGAEQKADALRAKADAKEAYAQSLDAGDAADAARAAADAADRHAGDAEAAAGRARTAADAAGRAAADADAAATRAEAAAGRARADADGAQAARLRADAAVKTATSAVADAIEAAGHAAGEADAAVAQAAAAERLARTAREEANGAREEAAKAVAASAKAAGFAYVTAQAAADAGAAASAVADPANDAIQIGSVYAENDSAASLVVLTGQASKTIAEQQRAVAEAHARNAAAEASAAKNLAEQAKGDAKQAYVHAAGAAGYASTARGYAKEALGYSADAAKAAAAASASLTRTVEYERQAAVDASAADAAAGRAEGYAVSARAAADRAALDASAARAAAAEAERAAAEARAAAERADVAAAEAERAAKDADKYAEEAQEAAESAERKGANEQVKNGAGTGVGGTFYVVDEDSVEITNTRQKNDCVIDIGFGGCTVTFEVTFSATVDFFFCADPAVPATASGCPSEDTILVKTERFTGMKKDVTEYFSKLDILQQTVVYQILKAVLVQDFLDCWHGSASGCAWAASNFIPGKAFAKIAEALNALDAALKTGIGVADAFKALKKLDVDPATLAKIENTVNLFEDLATSCKVNSFPGHTLVLMADGSRMAISEVRTGDRVLAEDPKTGEQRPQTVSATFAHDTDRLIDITFADGSTLSSTAGHRVFVVDRGWVRVAELHRNDQLRSADGAVHSVSELRDLANLEPREVYDLTVDGLHTFYVRTDGPHADDLLVHNCANLADELEFPKSGAHTLSRHVNVTPEEAKAFALENKRRGLEPISAVWTDGDIAQQAVDRVLSHYFFPNGKRRGASFDALDNFLSQRGQWRGKTEFPITGKWDEYDSLGRVYDADGNWEAAGNGVRVILKRLPGERGHSGFIVYTAYPLKKP
ncbi:polymorphic toxin-type HINT domain-containing protein [Streptomyces acidiscabies]|uniref:polymorphic toxin-type HINT domain-containing protein n=1 Tax=Streptomyces acidiscabies TaxID=42234 RepID=UPI0009A216C3|nr:polymorphic toxin-type HINT domain-containing protein [Streptomyces acidiscabies]